MASMKPESKREEFRRYLEKAGVMDSLTRVLVSLYEEPERPANAVEYFLERLASGVPMKAEMETLQQEINELRNKVGQLEEENDSLKHRMEQFEPANGGSNPTSAPVVGEEIPASPGQGSEGADEE